MRLLATLALLAAALSVAGEAVGQSGHDHAAMVHDFNTEQSMPTEPGQGAFAAVSEIVAMLMADPETDWDRVDISVLRQHLRDMDMLITHAVAEATALPDGAVFVVSLAGPGGEAAGRMVPAHAPVLSAETGWTSSVSRDDQSVVWTVTSPNQAEIIRALGFFGLMAVGSHHQPHHLDMATGGMVH